MGQDLSTAQLDELRLGGATPEALLRLPLLDEYRLLRQFGQGAMGRIYMAHDTLLNRTVAIKFLALHRAHPRDRSRFLTEARALAQLSHPNVVTLFRVGEVGGHLFLVSEFVRGQSLAQLPRPVPWQRVLELAVGLSRGLSAAHRQRILHRDIKPANVMLSVEGEIKLIDFGLAKLRIAADAPRAPVPAAVAWDLARHDSQHTLDPSWPEPPGEPSWSVAATAFPSRFSDDVAADGLTRRGTRIGTPHYMAPEVGRGEPALPASDVYSLGAVLFELCSGRLPHVAATTAEHFQRTAEHDAPPLLALAPGTSPELAAIIDRCLLRSADERFLDGEMLCLALERLAFGGTRRGAPPTNPYRGLHPFEREHSLSFFGRDSEVRTVVERLRARPLVAVAGDSGVGKSSLCRAGVLPQLLAGEIEPGRRWLPLCLLPGAAPLRALAEALASAMDLPRDELYDELRSQPRELLRRLERLRTSQRGLVLLVDQLEELVTQSPPAEAAAFADFLGHLAAARSALVLLTVRTDFLTRLSALRGLGEHIEYGLYLLPPMSRRALHTAIVAPAEAAGYHFDSPAMIDELLDGAQQTASGLPLLQFILSALWEQRDPAQRTVPAAALGALGGFAGALSRYADDVMAGLGPAQRAQARHLLPRLVTAEGTRRRCSIAQLQAESAAAQATLEAMVRGRLLAVREEDGQSRYELTHEALLSRWAWLGELLEQDREGRSVRERLVAAADEWQRLGGSVDVLWGERQLTEVARTGVGADTLPELPRRFLRAAQQQRRRRQRTRLFGIALVLGLPFLLVIVVLQMRQTRQARFAEAEQRRLRHESDLLEQGTRAANLAHSPGREVSALQTALRAAGPLLQRGEQLPSPVLLGLSAAVQAGRRVLPLRGHAGPLGTAFYSPSGQQLVTASDDGTAKLWDAASGKLQHTLAGHRITRTAVFSPDGAMVLTAGEDGAARLWDAASGAALATLDAGIGPLSAAYFSPDGRLLVLASFTARVAVWDTRRRQPLYVVSGFLGTQSTDNILSYAAFAPDGQHLVTGRTDGGVDVRAARTGRIERTLPAPRTNKPRHAYGFYAPAGDRLLTITGDSDDISLWDARTGQRLAVLGGHQRPDIASFSPDGTRLATTGADATIRLWDARSGQLLLTLPKQPRALNALTFSPDGSTLASAGAESVFRLWDVATGSLQAELRGHGGPLLTVRFAPDGQQLATASWDGTARLWSLGGGLHLRRLVPQDHELSRARYSRSGRYIAGLGRTGTVTIWDAHSGQAVGVLPGAFTPGSGVAFSPDETLIAVSGEGLTARIWDWQAHKQLVTLVGHTMPLADIAFTAAGDRVITASYDRTARVWDPSSGALLRTLSEHTSGVIFAVASPDGRRVATAQNDGSISVFSLTDGTRQLFIAGKQNRFSQVNFSPDGRDLIIGGLSPRIVDAQSGHVRRELHGHLDAVIATHFSRDGRRALTASVDQTIRLWDVASGQAQHVLRVDDGDFVSAELSPDGSQILLGSTQRNYVKLFPAQVQSLWHMGCALLRHQPEWAEVQRDCPTEP